MRFMILVKANEDSEAGVLPTDEQITEMAAFHEELAAAGALVAADGLQATSKGFRIRYDGRGRRTVIDGPFTEAKELVAGFTMIDVASREEALEWARRFPCPAPPGKPAEIEVRQVFELDDFVEGEGVERFRELERRKQEAAG